MEKKDILEAISMMESGMYKDIEKLDENIFILKQQKKSTNKNLNIISKIKIKVELSLSDEFAENYIQKEIMNILNTEESE